MLNESLLTYGQVAERYGLRRGTLYSMVHARTIPHVRLGPRLVMFARSELEAWLAAHRVPVTPSTAEGGRGVGPSR